MSITVTRANSGSGYTPAGHVGVDAQRLQGHEVSRTDVFWVGQSDYPPGAEAELSPAKQETVYVVLTGELTLGVQEGDRMQVHVLSAGDSVHLPAGTVRRVRNEADTPARMLVIGALPR